jgi:predicted nucleic acid-binding protein
MRELILDTNVLIGHWHRRKSRGGPLSGKSTADAEQWADELIEIEGTNAIVTPVYLEFVGGPVNGHEMKLTKTYLGRFAIIDGGRVTEEDWAEARRLAERIPRGPDARPRGAVDCLIKAIARRLRHDVRTFDLGMPR